MTQTFLERKLYAGQFDDGLLDLCVGVGLLGAGLAWLWDSFELVGVMPAVLAPLLPAVLLALGLLIVSVILGAGRFLAYALALATLAAVTTSLDGEPWLYLLLFGGLLSLWAAFVFARFLTTHPNLERE